MGWMEFAVVINVNVSKNRNFSWPARLLTTSDLYGKDWLYEKDFLRTLL